MEQTQFVAVLQGGPHACPGMHTNFRGFSVSQAAAYTSSKLSASPTGPAELGLSTPAPPLCLRALPCLPCSRHPAYQQAQRAQACQV